MSRTPAPNAPAEVLASQLREVALDSVCQRVHYLGGQSVPFYEVYCELARVVPLPHANEIRFPLADLNRHFKDDFCPRRAPRSAP